VKKAAVIGMGYTMVMVGAMCWTIACDSPGKALSIIFLLHICAVMIMTLRRLEKIKKVWH
jgi:hypothetical protein